MLASSQQQTANIIIRSLGSEINYLLFNNYSQTKPMQKYIPLLAFLFFAPFYVSAQNLYDTIDGIVYYDNLPVESALSDSFEVLSDENARDKNFCFFKNSKLKNCQPKAFDVLLGDYSKDNFFVYYEAEKIDSVDAKTFQVLDANYAKDRSRAYYKGQVISGAASDSFEIVEMGYARDASGLYNGQDQILGVDPASFEIINQEYYKDKGNVFFKGTQVENAHPGTFRMMANEYARDADYFYRYGKAVAKSSNKYYERFRENDLSDTCLPEASLGEEGEGLAPLESGFASDGNCVFYQMEVIDYSHPASFEIINSSLARDKNFVYVISEAGVKTVPFASASTFEVLGANYYKDKYVVYYGDGLEIINGADINTFKLVCETENCTYEAEDKNRFYLDGLEVGLDEATQQIIGEAKLVNASPDDIMALVNYNNTSRHLEKEIETNQKYVRSMIVGVYDLEERSKNAIINFILYGTQTTRTLGAGERAGVVNSYKASFGKLPQTEQDWSDVIKVANGRWPTERNEIAEERADRRFRYIYHRAPYSFDQHDQNALTIIAYGLRNRVRNVDSEKAAILTFRKLFIDYPSSASDWDMVRAIAYSGAAR